MSTEPLDDAIDELDHQYLARLVTERDDASTSPVERAYKQGRIDEYCAQNAIDGADVSDLDLRIPPEDDESLSLGTRL